MATVRTNKAISQPEQPLDTASGVNRKAFAKSLEQRIADASAALPNAKAPLELNEPLLKLAGLPGVQDVIRSSLARSLSSWSQREVLAKIQVLESAGLLDADAREYLSGIAAKVTSAEDHVEIKLVEKPVPRSAAETFANMPELGLVRHGSLMVKEHFESTDYPYWGPDDPAYTSRRWQLSLAVIEGT